MRSPQLFHVFLGFEINLEKDYEWIDVEIINQSTNATPATRRNATAL
jgi:hypothetical protein